MSGIINFMKKLIGFDGTDDTVIGLSSFHDGAKEFKDTPSTKKEVKKELTLSEMLRRS